MKIKKLIYLNVIDLILLLDIEIVKLGKYWWEVYEWVIGKYNRILLVDYRIFIEFC